MAKQPSSTSAPEAHKPHHLGKGVLLSIALLSILVIVASVVYGMRQEHNNKAATKPSNPLSDSSLSTQQKAEYLANKGNYSAGQQLLSGTASQLKGSNKPQDKVALANVYVQQTVLALNAQKYSDALKYAKLAESAQPTSGTAATLANVYLQMGNKASAKKFYSEAITRLDKSSISYNSNLETYQAAVRTLSK